MDKIDGTSWRKSSHSTGNGGNCVEAGNTGHGVAIRDTKQHGNGPALRFSPEVWRTFAERVKASA
jgi:hypothetical protein